MAADWFFNPPSSTNNWRTSIYPVKNDVTRFDCEARRAHSNSQTRKNKRKTRPRRLDGPNAVPNDFNNALNDCLLLIRVSNRPFPLLEYIHGNWHYPAVSNNGAGCSWQVLAGKVAQVSYQFSVVSCRN